MHQLGIMIVSHSNKIAEGLVDLLTEIAPDIAISYVGGTEEGDIGSSFNQVIDLIEKHPSQTILSFYDLGSAKMNLDLASEFSNKKIIRYNVPLIEGTYTAAALLQAGAELEEIDKQLNELIINK